MYTPTIRKHWLSCCWQQNYATSELGTAHRWVGKGCSAVLLACGSIVLARYHTLQTRFLQVENGCKLLFSPAFIEFRDHYSSSSIPKRKQIALNLRPRKHRPPKKKMATGVCSNTLFIPQKLTSQQSASICDYNYAQCNVKTMLLRTCISQELAYLYRLLNVVYDSKMAPGSNYDEFPVYWVSQHASW